MRLQKRRQGPDRQSCIALRAENARLVLERRRIDGDNYMRRVDPEIRQHVLIKNGPQKPVPVVEPREEVPRRSAPRSTIETGRHRAGGGAQERILQDDARCPARETDVVDANVDQQGVGGAFEDVLWSAAHDGAPQRRSGGGVEAGPGLLLRAGGIGSTAPRRARGAIGAEGVWLADFLIRQSDLGTAADDALISRGAPFDAVVAIEDAIHDCRARTAIR